MPLVNEANLGSPENFKAQGANFNQSQGFKNQFNNFNQTNQTETLNQTQKGLFTLPPALMQIVP
jgi:hypothetical protein